MGITIFAQGKLDRIEDIPGLIAELRVLAQGNNWAAHVLDNDFVVQPNAVLIPRDSGDPGCSIVGSLGLKGITLQLDPKTESLPILFDHHGVLTDIMRQVSWIDSNGQDERFTSCKTQFGEIDSHIRIIKLLDRLKNRYISNLSVTDEGDFWDSRDPRILAEKRIALGHYLRHTERVIGSIESADNDVQDAETIASRIEEALLKAAKEDGSLR